MSVFIKFLYGSVFSDSDSDSVSSGRFRALFIGRPRFRFTTCANSTMSNSRQALGFGFASCGLLVVCGLILTGCLQTRSAQKEQEEKQVMQKTVKNLQTTTADVTTRFQEIDEDLRNFNGRTEVNEFKINQLTQRIDKTDATIEARFKEMSDKLTTYQEAITKLDAQVAELTTTLAQVQEDVKKKGSGGGSSAGAGEVKSGPYALAEGAFKAKSWKDAIIDYEKYRKAEPKGKRFADATYKIGVCFQELGDLEGAKVFYEEVVAKFPKSKEAGKAEYRLSSLKKKK